MNSTQLCITILLFLFPAIISAAVGPTYYYLELDTTIQRELEIKSRKLRENEKKLSGFIRIILRINKRAAVDTVTITEDSLGRGTEDVINRLMKWRFTSIPPTMLPISIEYFLDINYNYKRPASEDDDSKTMLMLSRLYTPIGRGVGANAFIFPRKCNKIIRRGVVYKAEVVTDERDTSNLGQFLSAGSAYGLMIGPNHFPSSFYSEFGFSIGHFGSLIYGAESCQMVMLRLGSRFRLDAAIGFYEKLYLALIGDGRLFIGTKIAAGCEF